VRLPGGAGRVWGRRGRPYGGVLQRGAGLPVGVVPGQAQARRVTKTGFPAVTVYDGLRSETTGALAVWQAARMLRAWAQAGASIHCAPLPAGPIQTRQAAMRLNVSPLATLTVLLSTYRRDR
jgi:hypothetical protein